MNTFTLSKNEIALILQKSSLRSFFEEIVYELVHFLFKSDDFCLEAGHLFPKKRSPLSDFNFLPLDLFRLAECSASPTVLD